MGANRAHRTLRVRSVECDASHTYVYAFQILGWKWSRRQGNRSEDTSLIRLQNL